MAGAGVAGEDAEAGAGSSPSRRRRAATTTTATADPPNLALLGASSLAALLLLRSGLLHALLVLLCAALLLCNPWVRTLLELPVAGPTGAGAGAKARAQTRGAWYDPAEYLLRRRRRVDIDSEDDEEEEEDARDGQLTSKTSRHSKDRARGGAAQHRAKATTLDIGVMPPELRRPVASTLPLVVRDFVQFWYDPITFAHPSFLTHARAAIEHLCASIYLRTTRMNSVDFAHGLTLTFTSLLIASLRQRREELDREAAQASAHANGALPGMFSKPLGSTPRSTSTSSAKHSWPTTTARIASLRTSVSRLLSVHLPHPERESALVRTLLQEIIVRQLWDGVVCKMGTAEFWNDRIVEWSEEGDELKGGGAPVAVAAAAGTLAPNATLPTSASDKSTLGAALSPQPVRPPAGPNNAATAPPSKPRPPSVSRQSSSQDGSSLSTTATSFGRFTSNLFSGIVNAATRAGEVVGEAVDEAGGALLMGTSAVGGDAGGAPRATSAAAAAPSGRQDEAAREQQPPALPSRPPPPASAAAPTRSQNAAPWSSPRPGVDAPSSGESSRRGSTATGREASFSSPGTPPMRRRAVQPYDIPEYESSAGPPRATPSPSDRRRSRFQATTGEETIRMDHSIARSELPRDVPGAVELPESLRAGLGREVSVSTSKARSEAAKAGSELPPLPPRASNIAAQADRRDAGPAESGAATSSSGRRMSLAPSARETRRPPSIAAPPLSSLLDGRSAASSAIFDEFEGFLGQVQGGARPPRPPGSTSISSPRLADVPSTSPTRGETLLRLWTQLRTLRSIGEIEMQAAGAGEGAGGFGLGIGSGPGAGASFGNPDGGGSSAGGGGSASGMTLWASDVRGALLGQHGSATDLSDDPQLEEARDDTLRLLERVERHGLGSLDPLEDAVEARLQKLYAQFWVERGAALSAALSSSSSSGAGAGAGAPARALKMEEGGGGGGGRTGRLDASPSLGAVLGAITSQPLLSNTRSSPSPSAVKAEARARAEDMGAPPSFTASPASPDTRRKASFHEPGGSTASPTHRRTATQVGPGLSPSSPSPPGPSRAAVPIDAGPSSSTTTTTTATRRLTPDQIDTLISSVFQVAHEALGLTGPWTVRRGMLRVLEQVVRTTYASSVVGVFASAVSALSTARVGAYVDATRESWWPGGEWASSKGAEEETEAKAARRREERSVRAKEIVRSYAPAQVGYLLGPGGRQACESALLAVHASLTDPVTALDFSLTLTLDVLDSLTVGG